MPFTLSAVGENQMSELLKWRERLESAHKQMQEAMTELITNKNLDMIYRFLILTGHSPSTRR
jgi:hypothetical protein